MNQPPDWVPPTLLSDSLKSAGFSEQVSLLDPELCRKLAQAFDSNPWVESVEAVRVTGKPELQAQLVYRVPVALVNNSTGLYPVDRYGVLLPPKDFPMSDTERLPHIDNISSKPIGIGRQWPDAAVVAAASLAEKLTPQNDMQKYWHRFDLKSIIAPKPGAGPVSPDEMKFELLTTGGSRIVWGKPPGADTLEPSVENKIGRLEQYLTRFGSFDAPNGPYRIDIRLFEAISLEPLNGPTYR